jgi:hypothetical protein
MVLPKLHEKFTEAQLQIIWNAMVVEMSRWVKEDIRFSYDERPEMLPDEKYDRSSDNPTIPRNFLFMGDVYCKDPHVKGPDGEDLDVQILFHVRLPNFDAHIPVPDSRKIHGRRMGFKNMIVDLQEALEQDNFRNRWVAHTGQGTGWKWNVIFQTNNTNNELFDVEWDIHIVE